MRQLGHPTDLMDDVFVSECRACGAQLRAAHLEGPPDASRCGFCGTDLIPGRPDGLAERTISFEEDTPLDLLRPFERQRRFLRPASLTALSVLALVAIAVGAWIGDGSRSGERAAPVVPVTSAAPSPAPSSPTAPAAPTLRRLDVRVDVVAPTWLRATVDGAVVEEGTLPVGDHLELRADEEVSLRLGNAGGVEVRAGGKSIATGDSGDVLDLRLELQGGTMRVVRSPV